MQELIASIKGMQGSEFALLMAALVLVALVLFYFIWRNLRRARLIEDMPTAKVRSASQGYVEIDGFAEHLPGIPIRAPLSETECLWYRFVVERKQTSRGSNGETYTTWQTVRQGTSDDIFLFEDDTGQCVIDPEGAEVTPTIKDVWYGHGDLSSRGIRQTGILGSITGDYRYTEERLMPGPLYAIGWFKTLTNADVSLNEQVKALLREWKSDQQALLSAHDQNGDGRIDQHEWEAVRQAAIQQVVKERSESTAEQVTHVLCKPEAAGYPFLISDREQDSLAGRYRRNAVFSLVGVGLSVACVLWLLVVRLNQ